MIKTIVPQICDINLASSKYILEKYSNYLSVLNQFIDQIETALEYRSTFFKNDSVETRVKFFNQLQNYFDKFDNDFVAYWYEIFKACPGYIKSKVSLPSLLLESDSIGKFTNSYYLLDDSVCPISDWSMNSAPPPSYVPYNAVNKLSPWVKQIIERSSFRTNNMYRSNIMLVQPVDSSSLSDKAHGTNLVTDEGYYTRTVSEIKKKSLDKLLDLYKNEIKILLRYCNLNDNEAINYQDYEVNKSSVDLYAFKLQVEKTNNNVDILSNKIKYIKSRFFNDTVLSTEAITTISLREKTTDEIDRLYKNNLFNRLEELNPRSLFSTVSENEKIDINIDDTIKEEEQLKEVPTKQSNSDAANDIKSSPELSQPRSFNHYDGTIPYPAYQAPSWCSDITNCLGVGNALQAFNGVSDPLTNFKSTSSEDFDLFAELKKINPFNITFDADNVGDISDLLSSLNNIDLSQIGSLFGMNLPIPPFSIGNLFDAPGLNADTRTDALNQAQDTLLATFENTAKELLNTIVCGTAQTFTGGNV